MSSDEQASAVFVDLREAAGEGDRRVAWSHQSQDLNLNLIVLAAGQAIEAHRNNEVDVLLVAVEGQGSVEVDGERRQLRPGQAALIPKGALRGVRAASAPFAYLTCHGQRRGILPQPRR